MTSQRLKDLRDLGHILCGLHRDGFQGLVLVRCRELTHRIQLRQGLVFGAQLADRFDPLGRLLVRLGKLNAHNLKINLEKLAVSERLQGQLLCEMGLVHPADVDRALGIQLQQRMLRLLALRTACFTLKSGPVRAHQPPLHPYRLVHDHVAQLSRAELVAQVCRIGTPRGLGPAAARHTWVLDEAERGALRRLGGAAEAPPATLGTTALRAILTLHKLGGLQPSGHHHPVDRASGHHHTVDRASGHHHTVDRASGHHHTVDRPARLLQVHPGSSRAELRAAFLRMAWRLHPDRHPHATREQQQELAEQFSAAQRAYQALSQRSE